MNLVEPLPAPNSIVGDTDWWILELSDGSTCTTIQGTGIPIGDQVFHDTCGAGFLVDLRVSGQLWLAGLAVPSADLSTIEEYIQLHAKTVWR